MLRPLTHPALQLRITEEHQLLAAVKYHDPFQRLDLDAAWRRSLARASQALEVPLWPA